MPNHPLSLQHGGSLVEMLVATALGLMVLAGASPLLLQMLQQQAVAQQRLEQAEAVRFASQVISQHVRDASRIMPSSHSTLLEVLMPPATSSGWVSFGCIQTADSERLQIIYTSSTTSLSCKNATTNSPQQVLIDKLWPLQFEYQCSAPQGSSQVSRVSHTAATASACTHGVAAVVTTLQAPSANPGAVPHIRWTTVVRQAYWAHATP
jgi:Tfp pilus assembly protein PilW